MQGVQGVRALVGPVGQGALEERAGPLAPRARRALVCRLQSPAAWGQAPDEAPAFSPPAWRAARGAVGPEAAVLAAAATGARAERAAPRGLEQSVLPSQPLEWLFQPAGFSAPPAAPTGRQHATAPHCLPPAHCGAGCQWQRSGQSGACSSGAQAALKVSALEGRFINKGKDGNAGAIALHASAAPVKRHKGRCFGEELFCGGATQRVGNACTRQTAHRSRQGFENPASTDGNQRSTGGQGGKYQHDKVMGKVMGKRKKERKTRRNEKPDRGSGQPVSQSASQPVSGYAAAATDASSTDSLRSAATGLEAWHCATTSRAQPSQQPHWVATPNSNCISSKPMPARAWRAISRSETRRQTQTIMAVGSVKAGS